MTFRKRVGITRDFSEECETIFVVTRVRKITYFTGEAWIVLRKSLEEVSTWCRLHCPPPPCLHHPSRFQNQGDFTPWRRIQSRLLFEILNTNFLEHCAPANRLLLNQYTPLIRCAELCRSQSWLPVQNSHQVADAESSHVSKQHFWIRTSRNILSRRIDW